MARPMSSTFYTPDIGERTRMILAENKVKECPELTLLKGAMKEKFDKMEAEIASLKEELHTERRRESIAQQSLQHSQVCDVALFVNRCERWTMCISQCEHISLPKKIYKYRRSCVGSDACATRSTHPGFRNSTRQRRSSPRCTRCDKQTSSSRTG